MRIISGTHKSRQFHLPKNLDIRPTTDFSREALFNILQHRVNFSEKKVLDLFSGSGSISYEFASRGCREITCVEKNLLCCRFIQKTAREFGFENIRVQKTDAFRFLHHTSETFDIIFADPPFKLQNIGCIPVLVFENKLLVKDGMLIVEHPVRITFSGISHFIETRKYGTVNFSIFGNIHE